MKKDRYGYIGIETLLDFCQNSRDHAVTPNDFMRMQRIQIPILCEKCGVWDSKGAKHDEKGSEDT